MFFYFCIYFDDKEQSSDEEKLEELTERTGRRRRLNVFVKVTKKVVALLDREQSQKTSAFVTVCVCVRVCVSMVAKKNYELSSRFEVYECGLIKQ